MSIVARGRCAGDVLHPVVEPIDLLIQVLIQRLELIAAMSGVRRQRQRRQHRLAVSIPQRVSAPHAVPQRDRVQRVLHARPHAHPLMPVQQQGPQIPQLGRGHPDRRKPILGQQLQQQRRIASIVFLLARLRFADRRRMTHAARDPEFVHQLQKPSHRARGFDPHHDRRRQAPRRIPARSLPSCFNVFSTTSPVSRSNIAIVCWAACKSHPIIFISASFDPSAVSVDTHSLLRPSRGRRRYDIS